jgi:hypothetical protein
MWKDVKGCERMKAYPDYKKSCEEDCNNAFSWREWNLRDW